MAKAPRGTTVVKAPAVMAAGASEENAIEGKGSPPADPPKASDQPADKASPAKQAAQDGESSAPASQQADASKLSSASSADGFRDVLRRDGIRLRQIRDRAGDLEDAIVRTRTETHAANRHLQRAFASIIECT